MDRTALLATVSRLAEVVISSPRRAKNGWRLTQRTWLNRSRLAPWKTKLPPVCTALRSS